MVDVVLAPGPVLDLVAEDDGVVATFVDDLEQHRRGRPFAIEPRELLNQSRLERGAAQLTVTRFPAQLRRVDQPELVERVAS